MGDPGSSDVITYPGVPQSSPEYQFSHLMPNLDVPRDGSRRCLVDTLGSVHSITGTRSQRRIILHTSVSPDNTPKSVYCVLQNPCGPHLIPRTSSSSRRTSSPDQLVSDLSYLTLLVRPSVLVVHVSESLTVGDGGPLVPLRHTGSRNHQRSGGWTQTLHSSPSV